MQGDLHEWRHTVLTRLGLAGLAVHLKGAGEDELQAISQCRKANFWIWRRAFMPLRAPSLPLLSLALVLADAAEEAFLVAAAVVFVVFATELTALAALQIVS